MSRRGVLAEGEELESNILFRQINELYSTQDFGGVVWRISDGGL
jgi:hypothetical protein